LILLAQLGARRYYSVPKILHQAGILDHFYTDLYASSALRRVAQVVPPKLRPPAFKRALDRVPAIPEDKITSFSSFGLRYFSRLSRARSLTEREEAFIWGGQTFCERILQAGLGHASTVFTFNSAGLELLLYARQHGLSTVLEQTCSPAEVEDALLEENGPMLT
jgi:hypothetical protein